MTEFPYPKKESGVLFQDEYFRREVTFLVSESDSLFSAGRRNKTLSYIFYGLLWFFRIEFPFVFLACLLWCLHLWRPILSEWHSIVCDVRQIELEPWFYCPDPTHGVSQNRFFQIEKIAYRMSMMSNQHIARWQKSNFGIGVWSFWKLECRKLLQITHVVKNQ